MHGLEIISKILGCSRGSPPDSDISSIPPKDIKWSIACLNSSNEIIVVASGDEHDEQNKQLFGQVLITSKHKSFNISSSPLYYLLTFCIAAFCACFSSDSCFMKLYSLSASSLDISSTGSLRVVYDISF